MTSISPDNRMLVGIDTLSWGIAVWNLEHGVIISRPKITVPAVFLHRASWSMDSRILSLVMEGSRGITGGVYATDLSDLSDIIVKIVTDATRGPAIPVKFWVILYDPLTGKQIGVLPAGNKTHCWNPVRRQLAYVRPDNSTALVDLDSGTTISGIGTRYRESVGMAFSADGTRFLETYHDAPAKVWNTSTGKLVCYADTFDPYATESQVFAPKTGSYFLVNLGRNRNKGATIAMFDSSSGKTIRTITDPAVGGFGRLTINQDETLLATAADDSVRVWSLPDCTLLHTFKPEDGQTIKGLSAMRFSADNRQLFFSGNMENLDLGGVAAWDLTTGKKLWSYKDMHQFSVSMSSDGSRFVYCRTSPRNTDDIHILDLALNKELLVLGSHQFGVVAFNPARVANTLLINTGTFTCLWDGAAMVPVGQLEGITAAVSENGQWRATRIKENVIGLFKASDGTILKQFKLGDRSDSIQMAFSANSKYLYSIDYSGFIQKWDVAAGRRIVQQRAGTSGVLALDLVLSPDQVLGFVRVTKTQNSFLFSPDTLKPLRTMKAQVMAFIAAKKELVWVDPDKIVHFLPVTAKADAVERAGFKLDNASDVASLAVNKAGTYLALGFVDGSVEIRSVADGALLCTMKTGSLPVLGVAFVAEDKSLLCGSSDGTLTRFSLPAGTFQFASRVHDYLGKYFVYSHDGSFDASPGMENFAVYRQEGAVRFLRDLSEMRRPGLFREAGFTVPPGSGSR